MKLTTFVVLALTLVGCGHSNNNAIAGLAACPTRAASAKALAEGKDPRDIPKLIEVLNPGAAGIDCSSDGATDPTPAVAAAVASYGPAAVDPLLQALKKNATKGGAALALGAIGDKRAVDPLIVELRTALLALVVASGRRSLKEAQEELAPKPNRALHLIRFQRLAQRQ